MITPSQIRQKKISTVEGGGYDRNEVNELLLEVIESYEAVYAENKELYRKMEILANRIEEYRADEDTIKNAFITAQKTADKLPNHLKKVQKQHRKPLLMQRKRQIKLFQVQEIMLLTLQMKRKKQQAK